MLLGFFTDTMMNDCTVRRTVEFLGKKWTLLILLELYKGGGSRRFSEFRGCLDGITPKVLSARLSELEKEELVSKNVDSSSFPVKSVYTLTQSGEEVMDIIRNIKGWAIKWKLVNEACALYDCGECEL